jgi:hypothetical protein
MAENKTKPNDQSVQAFLDALPDEKRRQDCYTVLELMRKITGEEPKMWGDSIVGFGHRHYKYASGHEGDTVRAGFSPRKQNLTIYFNFYLENHSDLLNQLGKYKTGKGCLYIKKLEDVDLNVLKALIARSAA